MGQTPSCTEFVKQQQLHDAIKGGDLQLVMRIVEKDPRLIKKYHIFSKLTPLQMAALSGTLNVLNLLLENGADSNEHRRASDKTPLMLACKQGNPLAVKRLLDYGANVLAFDSEGRTCLHLACRGGHYECVVHLLDAARTGPISRTWGFTRFVNVRDDKGAIPIHMASRGGHAEIVRVLLNNGALVAAVTCHSTYGPGHGSTPLHCAARGGSLECVEELLAWGADRTQKDWMGNTPYVVAARRGHFAILNPNAAEPMVWLSPLKFMNELEPRARILLEAALAEANPARDTGQALSPGSFCRPSDFTEDEGEEQAPNSSLSQMPTETCNICFENSCTIEVRECGHQMCASCTLALCCHSKPDPKQVPMSSPAPSCPFCRRDIGRLTLVATPLTEGAGGDDAVEEMEMEEHKRDGDGEGDGDGGGTCSWRRTKKAFSHLTWPHLT